jgi:hypothetical protein
MNNNISNIFEAYYLNKINEEEARAFENQLSTDPELKKEYDNFRLAAEGIKAYGQELQERALEQDESYFIFRYLHGELSEQQEQQVEHRIVTDRDFANKVKDSRSILDIPASTTNTGTTSPTQEKAGKPQRRLPLMRRIGLISAIAASIALLITAAVYLLPQWSDPSARTAETIDVREHTTFSNNNMKGAAPSKVISQKAVEAAENGNYQRAEELLRQENTDDAAVRLMLAKALYCQAPNAPQKVKEARRILLQLLQEGALNEDKIRYTLAVSYLAAPAELEKAKEELTILYSKETPYSPDVKKLLQILEK